VRVIYRKIRYFTERTMKVALLSNKSETVGWLFRIMGYK
jgi:hypothetical protein